MKGASYRQYHGSFCTCSFHALTGYFYSFQGTAYYQLPGTIIISRHYHLPCFALYFFTDSFYFIVWQRQHCG